MITGSGHVTCRQIGIRVLAGGAIRAVGRDGTEMGLNGCGMGNGGSGGMGRNTRGGAQPVRQ